jgi:hypothetical protein
MALQPSMLSYLAFQHISPRWFALVLLCLPVAALVSTAGIRLETVLRSSLQHRH